MDIRNTETGEIRQVTAHQAQLIAGISPAGLWVILEAPKEPEKEVIEEKPTKKPTKK
jgi:hypothetical protein